MKSTLLAILLFTMSMSTGYASNAEMNPMNKQLVKPIDVVLKGSLAIISRLEMHYKIVNEHVTKLVTKIENDEDLNEERVQGLNDIKKAIAETEEFLATVNSSETGSTDDPLKQIISETSLIAKDLLPYLKENYELFLSPYEYARSDKLNNHLLSARGRYCTSRFEHTENIRRLSEQAK